MLRVEQDQAAELRRMVAERAGATRARGPGARLIAVTSGKGGVGKTNLAVNLAVAAGRLGKRVILIDLDLGMANADVLLGVRPGENLAHVLAGRRDVTEALVPAHGIQFLPGASGLERLANLGPLEREALHRSFERLERRADLVIVDTGAGVSRNVIDFAAAADEAIVVTTPEPTALVDAYALVKMLGREEGRGEVRVVVNMAQDKAEAERIATGVTTVAERFLKMRVDRMGYVLRDDAVGRAVRERSPFVVSEGRSAAAACVKNLAARMVAGGMGPEKRKGFWARVMGWRRVGA